MSVKNAIRDWWYGPDVRFGMHSTEVANSLMEYLKDAGYVIVPIKPTEKMLEEMARIGDGPLISGDEVWGYMLAATQAADVQ